MNPFTHVLHAELFKLVRKRRTWVLAGLWWLLLPITALVIARVMTTSINLGLDQEIAMLAQAFASPLGLATVAIALPAFSSPTFYVIVVAALAAVLMGEERSHGMWKSVLTTQPSRVAVLTGKLAAAMLVLGALMLGAMLSGALFGAIGTLFLPTTMAGDWSSLLGIALLQWLFAFSLVLFAFLMIHLTRNLAIGVITIFFLPGFLEGLYTVYAALVGFQPINRFNAFLQTIRLRQWFEDLPQVFFTSNLYLPSRQPLDALTANLTIEELDLGMLLGESLSLPNAALVLGVYSVFFLALLAWRFLRSDVD